MQIAKRQEPSDIIHRLAVSRLKVLYNIPFENAPPHPPNTTQPLLNINISLQQQYSIAVDRMQYIHDSEVMCLR